MNSTHLMGIVNVTPDSFFDKSRVSTPEQIEKKIEMHIDAGADWIDIGAESSRPGAIELTVEEELERLQPVFETIRSCPLPFSIDTRKAAVVQKALQAGAAMINDIEGFRDEKMRMAAAESDALLCVMHMPTTPATMQQHTSYPEGIIEHLVKWFEERTSLLMSYGIRKNRIVIDPGIGFGKTVDDNFKIIKNLPVLKSLGFSLLLGISRKSFIQKVAKKDAGAVLPGTLALNSLALLFGVDFLRVHDVAEHRQMIDILSHYSRLK